MRYRRPHPLRVACVVNAALCWLVSVAPQPALAAERAFGDQQSVGAVAFPISCAPGAQADFSRGVALLHSFFYEEARRIFTDVSLRDNRCAMAQWGIAMTWWHPIWGPPTPEEMRAGQTAAHRARALGGTDEREQGFIAAICAYYDTADNPVAGPVGQSCHGPVGPLERVAAYERAMGELKRHCPRDFEVRAFHALALLAVGYATPADTTLSNQLKAAEILEPLWRENPNHPGVVHYLIHSYDYPALARRGLPAAQAYAALAPWVPHALHMPSHIFTRLGMWDESIAANLSSAEASRAYARARHRDATESEQLHALDYLAYSYLQEGRDRETKALVDFVHTIRQTNPELEFSAAYGLAAIPARYALERRNWPEAASLAIPNLPHWTKFPFLEAMMEYARALGRARQGDLAGARVAVDRMVRLREATTDIKFVYFRMHLEQQLKSVSAWVSLAEGKAAQAEAQLRAAADAEDLLGKNPVSPGALVPAREQLGDLELQLGHPKEALAAYEASLKIYPGRFQGLYGAAVAAEKSGDKLEAGKYYAQLARQTTKADGTRMEMVRLREALAAL